MRTPCAVALEPPVQGAFQVMEVAVVAQMDFLVFEAVPEPFNEAIVPPAPLAVHAQAHSVSLEAFAPGTRSELAPLIGVEELRSRPCRSDRLFEGLLTEVRIEGVGSFQKSIPRVCQSITATN